MTLSISPDDIRKQLISTESKPLVSEAEMQQAVRTLLIGLDTLDAPPQKLPVTIVTGFLGSGKTTQ